MSRSFSGSDETIGSAGIVGSTTGSGGRVGGAGVGVFGPAGGGGIGRATGGFGFAHAAAVTSTITATLTVIDRCLIMLVVPHIGPSLAPSVHRRGGAGPAHAAYRDQFGYRLVPVVVSWRRFLPSRSITKICSRPARVELNATWRPLAENAGCSLLPIPSVRTRRLRSSNL